MINVKFKFSETEAVRSVVEVTKSLSPATIFMPWVGVIMIIAGIAYPLLHGDSIFSHSSIPLIMGVFFGALLVVVPLLTPLFAKKNFRSNPAADTDIEWVITNNDLLIKTAVSSARFPWHQLVKVEEKKAGFLLFPKPRTAHWMPKHGFSGEGDLEQFRDLIRKNKKKSDDL